MSRQQEHFTDISNQCSMDPVMHAVPATQAQVDLMLGADQTSNDGRSNWLIFTLPNGDVVFGCYPEGNTFDMLMNGRR